MIDLDEIRVGELGTKKHQIYRRLQEMIRSDRFQAGNRFPTTQAMAKHFGVSYMTMHLALSELERDGWLVRQQRKGTFVASTDKRKKTARMRLTMVLPPQEDIEAFGASIPISQILHGCCAGAKGHEADLAIHTIPSLLRPEEVLPNVGEISRFDGAIFLGPQYTDLMRELARRKYPVVQIEDQPVISNYVHYDRKKAVGLAIQHLLQHGYRRMGFMGTVEGPQADRYVLFCAALKELGHAPLDCVEPCPHSRDAHEAARRLLARHPLPEAVFLDNELKTEILFHSAAMLDIRIPEDMAILGYGASSPGNQPLISMIAIPFGEMGHAAVCSLVKEVNHPSAASQTRTLQASLLIAPSCGCKTTHKQSLTQIEP